ncbi:ABC transporter substrate-binding protein [Iodidimonas muriae]|uniref:ABC transporter substrate-binding protein n=1 Tax=Iodidimonas muriae TaxID=261467 RepID=A0ABQ2LGA1_9PROT|nr:TRAP transporter substrate-binding protein [Iodidimonas muriae]GER06960.1 ABC transporter substrate-binding protein [Kordiimonadales bacterium JCM 17843]GGO13585.1 ABC transporter substrate-binding protein [Iodidimonas muriae]
MGIIARPFWLGAILAGMLGACSSEQSPETDKASLALSDRPLVQWRMASTYPSSLIILGTMGKRVESLARDISGGSIDIRFYEPGALAPPFEIFDAISYGALEAGWSTPGYWAGREPALQLFSALPFGPSAEEYLAWFDYGGGRALYEKLYHRHNIHGLICGISPPEAAGWYKKPINKVEDFKGLKIRFFGLGGKVLEKLGASVQLLSGGDIFPALELGTIDGTEFSVPAVDLKMGFYQAAKHYYFPGWHQQSTFFELMINLDQWNALNATQQAQIEAVCSSNIRYGLSQGEALQIDAMRELSEKGVEFHKFSPEILEALETAWGEVADELSASNADFATGWDSLRQFRAGHRVWRERGYLKK